MDMRIITLEKLKTVCTQHNNYLKPMSAIEGFFGNLPKLSDVEEVLIDARENALDCLNDVINNEWKLTRKERLIKLHEEHIAKIDKLLNQIKEAI